MSSFLDIWTAFCLSEFGESELLLGLTKIFRKERLRFKNKSPTLFDKIQQRGQKGGQMRKVAAPWPPSPSRSRARSFRCDHTREASGFSPCRRALGEPECTDNASSALPPPSPDTGRGGDRTTHRLPLPPPCTAEGKPKRGLPVTAQSLSKPKFPNPASGRETVQESGKMCGVAQGTPSQHKKTARTCLLLLEFWRLTEASFCFYTLLGNESDCFSTGKAAPGLPSKIKHCHFATS